MNENEVEEYLRRLRALNMLRTCLEILVPASVVIFLMVVGFSIVGTIEHNDALISRQEYCHNVDAGIWPDYKDCFEKVCKQR